jgi:hypothetical protein
MMSDGVAYIITVAIALIGVPVLMFWLPIPIVLKAVIVCGVFWTRGYIFDWLR